MSEFRFKDGKTVEEHWTEKIALHLVGKKITRVEYLPLVEMEDNDWYKRPVCIQLDDKYWLVPMMDDEGNDGGAISTTFKNLETIPVI